MFPTLNPALQQQINNNNNVNLENQILGRSFLFDFDAGQFVLNNGKLVDTTKTQTINQWINLCTRTYIGKYEVYKNNGFGTQVEKLIGHKLNAFYRASIASTIKDGLLKNKEIKEVKNVDITENNKIYTISIDVTLNDNSNLQSEVII